MYDAVLFIQSVYCQPIENKIELNSLHFIREIETFVRGEVMVFYMLLCNN